MAKPEFAIGSKILLIDAQGLEEQFLGDVYTVTSNQKYSCNVQEHPKALNRARFIYYVPSDPNRIGNNKYGGWVNAETAEAALCFFNDADALRLVERAFLNDHLPKMPHTNVVTKYIAQKYRQFIDIKAILQEWCDTAEERGVEGLTENRRKAIDALLDKYLKQINLTRAEEAQQIADKRFWADKKMTDTTTATEVSKPKEFQMKVETKHYVNETEVSSMSIDQKVELIRNTEKRIAELQEVKTKSKMVSDEIERIQEFLANITKLFDGAK